jgi:hypothetical protein
VKASNPTRKLQAGADTLFQEIIGNHLGRGRQTVGKAFFGLSMSISVSVPNFIKIGSEMAEIQSSRVNRHGGGGHLGKWCRTVKVELLGFSKLFLVCVLNFIEIGSQMADIQLSRVFQHGGGGHFGKWRPTVAVAFFELSM